MCRRLGISRILLFSATMFLLARVSIAGPIPASEAIAQGFASDTSSQASVSHSGYQFGLLGGLEVANPLATPSAQSVSVESGTQVAAEKDSGMEQVNFSPVGMLVASSATVEVPEPATIVMLGLGAVGIFVAGRRRRK